MPYSPMKKSSCIKMYDSKGKPAGLMAEGSMAYMEKMSPFKHEEGPQGHEHDTNNPERYTYESTDIKAGKKRTGKARRKLANSLTEAANQGLDVQGYTTSGSSGSVQLKNKRLKVRTAGRGGSEGAAVEGQTSLNTDVKVKKRDVKKQLKETGTVTIKGGKVTEGTSQTVTKKGSVKSDARRSAQDKKVAEKKAAIEERNKAIRAKNEQKKATRDKKVAEKKAAIEQRREQARARA